jgi:tetratricopeptide (TPR) repeat protein
MKRKKSIKNNKLNDIFRSAWKMVASGNDQMALRMLLENAQHLEHLQDFHNTIGIVFGNLKDHDAAVQHFLKSIKINPLNPMPFAGIGNSLAKNLQFTEAEKYFELALVLDENYLDALVGKGVSNFQKSLYSESEKFFKRALEIKPKSSTVLTNLANCYSVQGRYEEALPLWNQAIALDPKNSQARMNRGMTHLGMGHFETAWHDYEHRFHEDNFIPERFKEIPNWPGPGDKTAPVLIWVEQGIGDEIMYASMYQELANLKEKFAAECNPRLIDTFKESFPHIFFFPTFSLKDHSAFKFRISIASLGSILRTNRQSFDRHRPSVGHLKQSADALNPLTRSALESLPKPWIGVSWESYALTMNFRNRKSIPTEEFSEFTKNFHGSFINLQFANPHVHECPTQHTVPENIHTLPKLDLRNDLRGLTSLLREMDQVVTIGNSVAHLCGAFGIPTTVLLPSVADWRWGFSGEKSVWYESLTLRRNKDPNSWEVLLSETRTELFNKYSR